jgi:hypothetical protein
MVEVSLYVHGRYPVGELAAAFPEIDDVDADPGDSIRELGARREQPTTVSTTM